MNKRLIAVISVFIVLTVGTPNALAQPPGSNTRAQGGCGDENIRENGVEIIIRDLQGGLDYTATAIGVDRFDPVLAIVLGDEIIECVDNVREIDGYAIDLPTTNFIERGRGNTQIRFNTGNQGDTEDVSIIVGEHDGNDGEFVLIMEGLFIEQSSEIGDIFSLRLTPQIIEAEKIPTVYAISVTGDLDPVLAYVNDEGDVIVDEDEALISCDDAGFEESCWGESSELENFFVTRSFQRQLDTQSYDAMLTVPFEDEVTEENSDEPIFQNYMVNSYQGSTFGDYVIAFHVAIQQIRD